MLRAMEIELCVDVYYALTAILPCEPSMCEMAGNGSVARAMSPSPPNRRQRGFLSVESQEKAGDILKIPIRNPVLVMC